MKFGFFASCFAAVLLASACGNTGSTSTVVIPPAETEKKVAPAAPVVKIDPPAQPPARKVNPRRLYQLDELQVVKIKIGTHTFDAWVMDTDAKRSEGMMFLKNEDFKDSECMVFVFPREQELGFWMRNTLVDLDIAYVNTKKFIVRAVTMKSLDETSVPSRGLSMYAIEFRAGLFKKLGIRAGQKVEIPSSVKSKD